jgi:hypothetical protein
VEFADCGTATDPSARTPGAGWTGCGFARSERFFAFNFFGFGFTFFLDGFFGISCHPPLRRILAHPDWVVRATVVCTIPAIPKPFCNACEGTLIKTSYSSFACFAFLFIEPRTDVPPVLENHCCHKPHEYFQD